MRRHGYKVERAAPGGWRRALALLALLGSSFPIVSAQTAGQVTLPAQVQQLTEAMARAQAQLEQSQRLLEDLRRQLAALQDQMAQQGQPPAKPAPITPNPELPTSASATSATDSSLDEIRERQAMQESQIATHEQTKVESASKYPVKITGLLLLNGFVNTSAVDIPATPTLAVGGHGSTGASVRQTILGFDARGPHLFGASSAADLRVDFDGTPSASNATSTSYSPNTTLLRLRTAHASLQWQHTQAFFSLDRPLFSPDSPSSLTAVAEPALAWSGNLYTWNPQLGVTHDVEVGGSHALRLQAALIDVGDAPASSVVAASTTTPTVTPTATEQSRLPGVEARLALLGSTSQEDSNHLGAGGYFARHDTSLGRNFDAWAATLDARLHLPLGLQLTATAYRGLGLGGLGGGAYKDFSYLAKTSGTGFFVRALNDVGGWAEIKRKINAKVETNAAFGMDNVFANDLRLYAHTGVPLYVNLARNRTFTGNVIYSPSAYLLFSIEYRRLDSFQLNGPSAGSNVMGLAVGYKF